MDTLTIRRVALSALHHDPANARSHDERNLDAIAASLKQFGQAEPLVVQRSSGKVIGGNGRMTAMKALGWTECDVVELDLDDTRATALGIALNRTSELASWNLPTLGKLLESFHGTDLFDSLGFSESDFSKLLDEITDEAPTELEDPGEQPPPEKPVTQRGDLWLLGDHRLLCGDSTSKDDVARVVAGAKAALLATDGPYAVDYDGTNRPSHDGKPSGKDWSDVYHEKHIKDLGDFLDQVYDACLPHCIDSAPQYMWFAHTQHPAIAAVFERHDIVFHQVIIWSKPSATFGHCYYRWRHEPCAFGWRRGHKPKTGYAALDTIWEADWDGKARIATFHPTSKPTRLFEIPMTQHTERGDVVLEPFNGSGSQLIAAEKLGRRCCALEISPPFVDGTIARFEQATGKKATLDGDGRTFEAVRKERGAS
ncbi:MAG: DNA modification methylase [Planctomycetes bacterium]|nr:DNA modification methylase [Planctomycetota bacterium]